MWCIERLNHISPRGHMNCMLEPFFSKNCYILKAFLKIVKGMYFMLLFKLLFNTLVFESFHLILHMLLSFFSSLSNLYY